MFETDSDQCSCIHMTTENAIDISNGYTVLSILSSNSISFRINKMQIDVKDLIIQCPAEKVEPPTLLRYYKQIKVVNGDIEKQNFPCI